MNLDEAPDDALQRLMYLSGVAEQARAELDQAYAEAYYQVRLERRLDAALDLELHATRRVLAMTRAENERRGRAVRWGDGHS